MIPGWRCPPHPDCVLIVRWCLPALCPMKFRADPDGSDFPDWLEARRRLVRRSLLASELEHANSPLRINADDDENSVVATGYR